MSSILLTFMLGVALAEGPEEATEEATEEASPQTSDEAAAEAPPPEGLEEVIQEARDAFQDEGGVSAPRAIVPPSHGHRAIPPDEAGMAPARLKALRNYRNQHLEVRAYRYQTGGGGHSAVIGMPHHGVGYGGFFSTVFWTDPVRTHHTWGVYQGAEIITTPRFFELAGADKRLDVLSADILKARSASQVWNGVAVTGAVGVISGIVGMSMARTDERIDAWGTVFTMGSVTAITGLIASSFPSGKLQRLLHTPATIMTSQEAQGLAERANESLAKELGLNPEEAWKIEQGGTPDARPGRAGKPKRRR